MTIIGESLKQIRIDAKGKIFPDHIPTISDIARIAGVSPQAIDQIENGFSMPSSRILGAYLACGGEKKKVMEVAFETIQRIGESMKFTPPPKRGRRK